MLPISNGYSCENDDKLSFYWQYVNTAGPLHIVVYERKRNWIGMQRYIAPVIRLILIIIVNIYNNGWRRNGQQPVSISEFGAVRRPNVYKLQNKLMQNGRE